MQRKYFLFIAILILSGFVFLSSCKEEDEYSIPNPVKGLTNDVIKRTLGPNLSGQRIEFAYAMAVPPDKGKLVSAQVEATIAGADGTFLENKSYYTNGSGQDVGIQIGDPSVTNGNTTRVTFTRDTSASTLRYYYVIPDAARGKSVSFTFSATSSNGEKVSYTMGPYVISTMDMVLDQTLQDGSAAYLSIEDLKIYSSAEAEANAAKIDLVYLYRATPAAFSHALVAPSVDAQYRPGITLPAGATRKTKISKVWGLRDFNLARLQYGIYIDDVDFQVLTIADAPDYALNLKAEAGAWVETADGKYRAYIYVNSIDNAAKSMKISIKRYKL